MRICSNDTMRDLNHRSKRSSRHRTTHPQPSLRYALLHRFPTRGRFSYRTAAKHTWCTKHNKDLKRALVTHAQPFAVCVWVPPRFTDEMRPISGNKTKRQIVGALLAGCERSTLSRFRLGGEGLTHVFCVYCIVTGVGGSFELKTNDCSLPDTIFCCIFSFCYFSYFFFVLLWCLSCSRRLCLCMCIFLYTDLCTTCCSSTCSLFHIAQSTIINTPLCWKLNEYAPSSCRL